MNENNEQSYITGGFLFQTMHQLTPSEFSDIDIFCFSDGTEFISTTMVSEQVFYIWRNLH